MPSRNAAGNGGLMETRKKRVKRIKTWKHKVIPWATIQKTRHHSYLLKKIHGRKLGLIQATLRESTEILAHQSNVLSYLV
uniref:AlNc14C58G4353 protein n=1 Tax=Albugo laibachii Nc14 TaxID=890382 RepID=F0WCH5_9STRA|nr:AlNc14C58G4353 [Albugo laibachii Nc14]|eukprot:CCA18890.1 AlNc14C58G4353 [Albugo laibachii Nc14]